MRQKRADEWIGTTCEWLPQLPPNAILGTDRIWDVQIRAIEKDLMQTERDGKADGKDSRTGKELKTI